MTIREAITAATRDLTEAGVEDPRTTAQSLLAHRLEKDRTYLLTHFDEHVEPTILSQFQEWVKKRASGVPFQYLTGHQEFYGLDFVVTPDVLIPRPETEFIVDEVLKRNQTEASVIIDVGTGSGCLAVTLAVRMNHSRIIALDISESALNVARLNAQRQGVEDLIQFFVSDLFSALSEAGVQASFIVSNPPYVSDAEFPTLPREVREYEPRAALVAGPDGLIFFRRLLTESPACLELGGWLMMEMGFGQHDALTRLVDPSIWSIEKIGPDLQGIPRTLVLRLIAKG